MKKMSIKNLSLLGLVLMGASAVTAAILPKTSTNVRASGVLVDDSTDIDGVDGQLTCKQGVADNCDFTATGGNASFTTGGVGTSADGATTHAGDYTNTGGVFDGDDRYVTTLPA
jgi:hypothetical protein